MRLYTCFTPSHRPLLEQHFLPSLPYEFKQDNLRLKVLSQRSTTGAFASDGFQATCLDKVEFIIDAISSEKEPFLFSDVDVRFYGPVVDDLLKCLGDADMAFQWDGPRGRECTGFMVIRPSARVDAFWNLVAHLMVSRSLMDQDALHVAIDDPRCRPRVNTVILPDRYWTFGRNDKHWKPGVPVNPPVDLLVYHANWTVGIENKLRLLDEVKRCRDSMKAVDKTADALLASLASGLKGDDAVSAALSDYPPATAAMADENGTTRWLRDVKKGETVTITTERMLPYSEVTRMLEDQRRVLCRNHHHPLPLALVLQFFSGDRRRAIDLAKLLADLEPARRDDVCFVFARQDNCPMDAELQAAQLYVGKKFPVMDLVAKTDPTKKYPGVCFDPFASACGQLAEWYYSGRLPYANAFFFEPDGCPIGSDWVDRLKAAHAETLMAGKRVTGPRMRFGGIDSQHQVAGHINGTLVMHLSMWFDRPSIQRCPPNAAWDVVNGTQFVAEAGTSQIIRNEHGGRGLSESLYWVYGKECCWIASIKDGSAHHWLRASIEQQRERAEGRG